MKLFNIACSLVGSSNPTKNAYKENTIFFYRYYSQAKSAQTPKKMAPARITTK
jgi:hypothetical protein